jgi:hypothetical protein
MQKFLAFMVLIIFLSSVMSANANDTAFGGSGSSPMPIKQAGVKMVDEHIILQGKGLERGDLKGAWQVNCNFTFKNMLNKMLKFSMGFPFPVNDEMGETAVPAGYQAKLNEPLVYDFTVWVDGKSVPTKLYKIAANPAKGMYYKDAYIWSMDFAPQQTIKIRHQYLTGITTNVVGQMWASYVLKTGGLWQGGRIGQVLLEVIPNVPTRMCSELKTAEMQRVVPTLAGVKVVGSKASRKYIWEFKDFNPQEDLDLCFQTGRDYIRHRVIYPILHGSIALRKLNAAQLRILRNTIFAQYGRAFKDSKLQAYFDKQWWYVRNSNYSNAMLTSEDRQAIAVVNKGR